MRFADGTRFRKVQQAIALALAEAQHQRSPAMRVLALCACVPPLLAAS
jgi:hypothetical protein